MGERGWSAKMYRVLKADWHIERSLESQPELGNKARARWQAKHNHQKRGVVQRNIRTDKVNSSSTVGSTL